MDDLFRLLKNIPVDQAAGIAVATVVNTRGSAYRRPGARMIVHGDIGKNGVSTSSGAVSAGCLERDVIVNCDVFKDNPDHAPMLLTYDGSSADELIFGLKLGCDGIVQVLVEAANQGSVYQKRLEILRPLLSHALSVEKRAVAVTIFDVFDMEGTAEETAVQPADILGLCMFQAGQKCHELTSLPQTLKDYLRAQSSYLLKNKNPRSVVLQEEVDGWLVSALLEVVEPTTSLLVLGSGQDVQPLVEMADVLGWNVVVSDGRWAASEAISNENSFLGVDGAIIMTHDYDLDRQILSRLIKADIGYLGIVGPKKRADKLVAELALGGQPITDETSSKIYSPVGLDIGAERPEEIALSILAEVKAALAGHAGGMLRDKRGSIHAPLAESTPEMQVPGELSSAAANGEGAIEHRAIAKACSLEHSNIGE